MAWEPGKPVLTEQDRSEWRQWRRDRKRQQQRERRARNPRVDYYPSAEALALVGRMCTGQAGGDVSSVLNRIVAEWVSQCHRNKVA